MWEQIKAFMLDDFFGIEQLPMWGGILAICLAILLIAIVIICVCVSKSKKKKIAENSADVDADNAVSEEQAIEEDVMEEIPSAPIAITEEAAPVVEEAKAEEPVAAVEEAKAEEAVVLKEAKTVENPKTDIKEEEPKLDEKKDAPKPIARKLSSKPAEKKPTVVGAEALPKKFRKEEKKPEIKKEAVAAVDSTIDTSESFGKFCLIMDDRNSVKPYKFVLKANNGQVLFESEPYKVKPRMNSIAAFKKHVNDGEFQVDEDKVGLFRYKLYSATGALVGVGETYKTRAACESAVQSVKKFAESATYIEDLTVDKEEPTA